MIITIEGRELKKLVNSLVMSVLDNFMEKKFVADREGFEKNVCLFKLLSIADKST